MGRSAIFELLFGRMAVCRFYRVCARYTPIRDCCLSEMKNKKGCTEYFKFQNEIRKPRTEFEQNRMD